MKKTNFILRFCVIMLVASSCTIKKEVFNQDNLEKEYYIIPVLNVKHGEYILFDHLGDTILKAFYHFNKLYGNEILFFDGGSTIQQLNTYKKGKLNGMSYQYYSNGICQYIVEYKKNRLWNVLELYDILGNNLEKGTLKNGNGTVFKYYKDGTIMEKGLIQNGYREGDWEFYTNTGYSRIIKFKKGYDILSNTEIIMY